MSIVPVGDQTVTPTRNLDIWDPESFFNLDLWDPFETFPSIFPSHFPSIFPSTSTQVNWRETPTAHVLRAVFPPGSTSGDVLVYIDDENMLQVSTEDGKFMSRFKVPENGRRDQVKASMVGGVLTVTIPKDGVPTRRPNRRTIEISGSG